MNKDEEEKKLREGLVDEYEGVILYEAFAQIEKDPRLAEVYRRMAEAEHRHVSHIEERLKAKGLPIPEMRLSLRGRMMLFFARWMGVGAVLPSLMSLEQSRTQGYQALPQAEAMARDENSHARLLRQITGGLPGGVEGGVLAQVEGRHRGSGGNALRAAVLGANDGLVSNLSLVMGVVGASFSSSTVLITGMAGLLAGACSMALGEWLSVQSSRELFQRQISIEKAEIASAPEEEAEELALIYQARGLSEQQAHELATSIISNQESALETLAREELSVDPAELGGSAWEAAITSFVLFAIGAIVPVLPFIFLTGMAAILGSIGLSMIGLFILGAGTSLFTGRSILFSGMRMVIFSLVAAGITYFIGRLIGVSLAG